MLATSNISQDHPVSSMPTYGGVPVRNIWLLMLYANKDFPFRETDRATVEQNPDELPDVIAEILLHIVTRRLRRNLSVGYRSNTAELTRVRGSIEHLQTQRKKLLLRGRVACTFEELTIDNQRNRYVRTALETMDSLVRRKELKHQCRSLARVLQSMGVSNKVGTTYNPLYDRTGRRNAEDRKMLSAAKLAFDLALPVNTYGRHYVTTPPDEIGFLRKLFEKAIAGFYELTLAEYGWKVHPGKKLNWQISRMDEEIRSILPQMQADIVLDHKSSGRRIVIDTKFNKILTKGYYREQTLRSSYIYQMYAYLKSQQNSGDPLDEQASGMLLHPSTGVSVDTSVTIQGQEIRFVTVDLTKRAAIIREQLLQLIS